MGASSRSPSPMTIVPRMGTVSITRRIASTATWSACLRSPWPMVWADAIAASSTTRTNSNASSNSSALEKASLVFAVTFVCVAMPAPRLESVNPSNVRTDNQRMDVVRSFVGLHGFQVHHVAHDGVIVADAIRAQDIARDAGALQRHPHIIALGHGDMLMLHLLRVFQAADL